MKPVATHFHRNLAPKEGKLSMLKNVNFCPSVLDDFMYSLWTSLTPYWLGGNTSSWACFGLEELIFHMVYLGAQEGVQKLVFQDDQYARSTLEKLLELLKYGNRFEKGL
ncbi:unnamed protein product, partial [Linum tenue]